MSPLNARSIKTFTDAYKARKPKVNLNKLWSELHSEFQVGRISGKFLHLSSIDYRDIRDIMTRLLGVDPVTLDLSGNRNSVARQIGDEKLAKEKPMDFFASVIGRDGHIPSKTQDAEIPKHSSLTVDVRTLDLKRIAGLVVVENLDSFMCWLDFQAPAGFDGYLAIYRGHTADAKAVKWLCANTELPVAAFTDFDIAGARIALSLGADEWLVPRDPGRVAEMGFDKPDAYLAQHSLNGIDDIVMPDAWLKWCEWLNQHQTTLTQQGMLAANAELIALSRG